VIVAPGGAFYFLAIDKEGYDVARLLTKWGITAFVLKYRLAHTPEDDAEMLALLEGWMRNAPIQERGKETPPVGSEEAEAARLLAEEDGRQAIRFVRKNAEGWGLDPQKIGIMGFSAGGGVAVAAALEHDEQSRPNFVAGIYPGYRTKPVPPDAPPLFLATADDDILVGPVSVARLYESWHKAGIPVELHIFSAGGHGFGSLKQNLPSDAWLDLFKNWLKHLGYL
ncbi:MAG: alpha/beta hydrolase fold domain-containing protein, partial [Armatimonadota bacterium]|nr:alpha/beta hydrolase fold domain-containing protein [Armatimonadota bacterium]MDW8143911.1 alpha/beta hydrolase fold domain-containing protein [Armatimonadota bacterium]